MQLNVATDSAGHIATQSDNFYNKILISYLNLSIREMYLIDKYMKSSSVYSFVYSDIKIIPAWTMLNAIPAKSSTRESLKEKTWLYRNWE